MNQALKLVVLRLDQRNEHGFPNEATSDEHENHGDEYTESKEASLLTMGAQVATRCLRFHHRIRRVTNGTLIEVVMERWMDVSPTVETVSVHVLDTAGASTRTNERILLERCRRILVVILVTDATNFFLFLHNCRRS